MGLGPVSEVEINTIVSKLKGLESSGPDCMPTKASKFILPLVSSPLKRILNPCFKNRIFPAHLSEHDNCKDFLFGFRAKHSNEYAYAALLNFVHSALDSGLIPIPSTLFLDV